MSVVHLSGILRALVAVAGVLAGMRIALLVLGSARAARIWAFQHAPAGRGAAPVAPEAPAPCWLTDPPMRSHVRPPGTPETAPTSAFTLAHPAGRARADARRRRHPLHPALYLHARLLGESAGAPPNPCLAEPLGGPSLARSARRSANPKPNPIPTLTLSRRLCSGFSACQMLGCPLLAAPQGAWGLLPCCAPAWPATRSPRSSPPPRPACAGLLRQVLAGLTAASSWRRWRWRRCAPQAPRRRPAQPRRLGRLHRYHRRPRLCRACRRARRRVPAVGASAVAASRPVFLASGGFAVSVLLLTGRVRLQTAAATPQPPPQQPQQQTTTSPVARRASVAPLTRSRRPLASWSAAGRRSCARCRSWCASHPPSSLAFLGRPAPDRAVAVVCGRGCALRQPAGAPG